MLASTYLPTSKGLKAELTLAEKKVAERFKSQQSENQTHELVAIY